jgi:hypothetical protein
LWPHLTFPLLILSVHSLLLPNHHRLHLYFLLLLLLILLSIHFHPNFLFLIYLLPFFFSTIWHTLYTIVCVSYNLLSLLLLFSLLLFLLPPLLFHLSICLLILINTIHKNQTIILHLFGILILLLLLPTPPACTNSYITVLSLLFVLVKSPSIRFIFIYPTAPWQLALCVWKI